MALKHLCNFCSAAPAVFFVFNVTPDYLCFLYLQINHSVFVYMVLLALTANPAIN